MFILIHKHIQCIYLSTRVLILEEADGLRADPGFYTINFAPTKRPTVLALSATTCEHVAVSPETAMGCRRIRFLQVEEGYNCTLIL